MKKFLFVVCALVLTMGQSTFATFQLLGTASNTSYAKGAWISPNWQYAFIGTRNGGLQAYSISSNTLTYITSINPGGYCRSVSGDDNYIYLWCQYRWVYAYTFNGSSFTQVGFTNTRTDPMVVRKSWNYLFAGSNYRYLKMLTFNWSAFTEVASVLLPSGCYDAVYDGDQTVYALDKNNWIFAYHFDGSSLTLLDSDDPGTSTSYWGLRRNGTHIYYADTSKVYAYTFDWSSLTKIAETASNVWWYRLRSNGYEIYVADFPSLRALTFDGLSFSVLSESTGIPGQDLWGRGSQIIAPDTALIALVEPETTTTPAQVDFFSLNSVLKVALSTPIISDIVTVSGIPGGTYVDAQITEGAGEISVNGWAWSSATQSVTAWNNVRVRLTSSANQLTETSTVLDIDGKKARFSLKTEIPCFNYSDGFLTIWEFCYELTPNTLKDSQGSTITINDINDNDKIQMDINYQNLSESDMIETRTISTRRGKLDVEQLTAGAQSLKTLNVVVTDAEAFKNIVNNN